MDEAGTSPTMTSPTRELRNTSRTRGRKARTPRRCRNGQLPERRFMVVPCSNRTGAPETPKARGRSGIIKRPHQEISRRTASFKPCGPVNTLWRADHVLVTCIMAAANGSRHTSGSGRRQQLGAAPPTPIPRKSGISFSRPALPTQRVIRETKPAHSRRTVASLPFRQFPTKTAGRC